MSDDTIEVEVEQLENLRRGDIIMVNDRNDEDDLVKVKVFENRPSEKVLNWTTRGCGAICLSEYSEVRKILKGGSPGRPLPIPTPRSEWARWARGAS